MAEHRTFPVPEGEPCLGAADEIFTPGFEEPVEQDAFVPKDLGKKQGLLVSVKTTEDVGPVLHACHLNQGTGCLQKPGRDFGRKERKHQVAKVFELSLHERVPTGFLGGENLG
jgi:hypothetical protein